jgi:polar amino acid transport system substrate-binding protein
MESRVGVTFRRGAWSLLLLGLFIAGQSGRAEPLVVGANIGNVPWEFQARDGQYVGFEIDLARALAEALGRDLELRNIPFNGLFAAVQSGRIDVAASSISVTPQRLGQVAFTQPFYDSDQSLTVLKASPVQSLEDLKGRRVGVDTGSTGDIWATAAQGRYGIGSLARYEGLAPAMLDLQSRRIDAYLSDIPSLLYYAKDKPFLRIAERIETGERYALMMAKDSAVLEPLDAALGELKRNGTLAALHEKWFGQAPAPGSSTVTVLPRPQAP